MLASICYLLNLGHGIGTVDDIDHLGNRRLRCVGAVSYTHLASWTGKNFGMSCRIFD